MNMENIELVIKIPKEYYKAITEIPDYQCTADMLIIKNGKPLPKGHGRLIILSEDAVKREQTPLNFSCQNWISEVGLSNATVAIIEADKKDCGRMKNISDTLTVTFDGSLDDEIGMCVSRIVNGKIAVLKMKLGEQADILYHLLTNQTAKAEIKESEKV